MINDDPYREDLQVIDRELRNHYEYKKQLEEVNERIAEIDEQLTSIGSPRIMSPDEAKYQKGTKIYSDINMLELFQEQDQLIKQKQDEQRRVQEETRRKQDERAGQPKVDTEEKRIKGWGRVFHR